MSKMDPLAMLKLQRVLADGWYHLTTSMQEVIFENDTRKESIVKYFECCDYISEKLKHTLKD